MNRITTILALASSMSLFGHKEVIAESVEYHTVESGDTLYSIANDYGYSVDELVNYNDILDPNLIHPGDNIYIPDPDKVTYSEPEVYVSDNYWNGLTNEQYNILLMVVQQEAGVSASYDAKLAVMSVITNRVDVNYDNASNVWDVITSPGQFESYGASHYTRHYGQVNQSTISAVNEALNGRKNNSYLNFWSQEYANNMGQSGELFGGNVFFNM